MHVSLTLNIKCMSGLFKGVVYKTDVSILTLNAFSEKEFIFQILSANTCP